MKSSEERIAELEQRVAYLEDIVKNSERKESKMVNPNIVNSNMLKSGVIKPETDKSILMQNKAIHKRAVPFIRNQQEEKKYADNQGNTHKDKEALVGKYIIGVLAAVLIFVGAISFISLVWNRMTPEIKLFIISLAGIGLSVLGFRLVRTKKNPITSIILGTGAGLLFIAILSANLVFHKIGNHTSLLLAGIWAVMFIISSRYTNLFLTTIIAYIGSYLTLILGLVLMQGDTELWLLILFTLCISVVMIYTTFKKNKVESVTSIILSLISFFTILIRCYMDGLFVSEQLLSSYTGQIVAILMIYLLMNMFYKSNNNNNSSINMAFISLGIGTITTIWTALFISYLNDRYLNLKIITCCLLFFIVHLIQFILNHIFYKRIEIWLTRYYAIVLVFASIFINVELYQVPTGVILIGVLLIASQKILKGENQPLLIGLIILLDSLFFLSNNSDHLICSVYGILQLGLMGYVLWERVDLKKYAQINALKTISIVVIIINSFRIPSNIINFMNIPYFSEYVDNAVGYCIAVIAILALLKVGYFKNWESEQFHFFGINDKLEDDKNMQGLLYLFSTGLYFYGLQGIASVDKIFLQLIFTLATIGVALLQSKIILSNNSENRPFIGIWIVIKYLMLTWTILGAFSELSIISAAYSIVGLLVAIGCIVAGFKLRNKSIRLYGLVLTIIMVAKFILVDLNQENSITKVLALIAGGCLCFLISLIYNKLSENYS